MGGFRGSKNQKSGKCHELPRKSIKQLLKKNPVGVGWGGNFSGQKIKSPGNVMNCPENPQKFKTRWGGWGGVEVLGGQKIKSPGSVMNCPENQ